jgi:hypothetical protein
VPQYAGRKGHARKVSRRGPERPHGPAEVVPLHQHLDQYARGHQDVQQRRRPAGGVAQGLCIGLGGGEIATPEGEPGPMRQHRRNDHPVGGGLRLDHGGVEKHLGFAVALGAVQRYHRALEPGRVTWLRQPTRAGGNGPAGQAGHLIGRLVGQRGRKGCHGQGLARDCVLCGLEEQGPGSVGHRRRRGIIEQSTQNRHGLQCQMGLGVAAAEVGGDAIAHLDRLGQPVMETQRIREHQRGRGSGRVVGGRFHRLF